jgi:SP family facilitated glucose transporter-like MFS transporter 9
MALIVEGVIQVSDLYVLLVCRILQGIFIGNYMAMVPIYINDLSPKEIVGSFGVFTNLFVVIGVVAAFLMAIILTSANASN